MDTQYNHSIKVPSQYRVAARLLKKTFEEGASLKGLIFQEKHAKTNRLYALIQKISDNKHVLDRLIAETQLREKEPRLEKYLCAVLMTELLFGAGHLSGESKPVQCIRRYEHEFRTLLAGGKSSTTDGTEEAGTIGEKKAEKSSFYQANEKPMFQKESQKPRYVRVNTNVISRADAMELFVKDGWIERPFAADTQTYDEFLEIVRTLGGADFVSDMHVKNLFVFPASSKRFWARNTLVRESKLILQDKASCLPTVLLDPPRGSTILDMCAAPGMKTSHLAAHIKNKGTIYAVEQHVRRYGTLCEIMANTRSLSSVQTINQDALALEDEGVPGVEYILVDPSCSGSGMTSRLFSTPDDKESDRLVLLCGLQMRMLQHAMRAFYGAKKIVYSTCSVHVEENEQVVSRSLEACPDWKLVKPAAFAERWKNFGSAKWKHVGKKCFYAKPEVDLTDGFFVAVFQRREGADGAIEGRVHDPDREFLEDIHRNFSRKPTDYGLEHYALEEVPTGNPFNSNNQTEVSTIQNDKKSLVVKDEPIDETPIEAKNGAETSVLPKKEKKRKHDKSTTVSTANADSEKAVQTKQGVPENDFNVKVEPVEEASPQKKKKKNKKAVKEEIVEVPRNDVTVKVEPVKEAGPQKKKKKNNKAVKEEIVDSSSILEQGPHKKNKNHRKHELPENDVTVKVERVEEEGPHKKKKKINKAVKEEFVKVPENNDTVKVEPVEETSPQKKTKKSKKVVKEEIVEASPIHEQAPHKKNKKNSTKAVEIERIVQEELSIEKTKKNSKAETENMDMAPIKEEVLKEKKKKSSKPDKKVASDNLTLPMKRKNDKSTAV